METKTCSINDDEIRALIKVYANELTEENIEESLERMNYLNRRLKADKKEKAEPQATPTAEEPKASW